LPAEPDNRGVAAPELSVVVASHDRPLRLRWLLNALDQQTLDRRHWEVVVCHDSRGPDTERLLSEHPLAAAGTLRWTALPVGSGTPGAQRNAALSLARSPTVVFTDDDCRPPERWLEHVLEAVRRFPGSIVQGPIEGDPDEATIRRAPYPYTQSFSDVPRPWAECCNIVYPRELIERVGGFAEDLRVGEDTDLNLRARAGGAAYRGDQRMATFHALEERSLPAWVRQARRWGDVVRLVKRHPELRRELALGVFWKREHALLLLAVAGVVAGRARTRWLALCLPWAFSHRTHGTGARGRIRQLLELPGWAAIDASELLALLEASVRHRVIVL
jgi:GT2 family glycosyltransferase